MDVLLIKNGVVENCICADSVDRAQQFYPEYVCIERTPELGVWGPGSLFDGTTWSPAPPVPVIPQPITKLEFLRRFTAEQRVAIRTAVATDPVIADGMGLLDLAQDVLVTDPDTVYFVNYLRDNNYITQSDVDRVLG
jgi:hypothetical protein